MTSTEYLTTTAADLGTGDQLKDGRTVLNATILGDLVQLALSVPKDGDYERVEAFVLAETTYQIKGF